MHNAQEFVRLAARLRNAGHGPREAGRLALDKLRERTARQERGHEITAVDCRSKFIPRVGRTSRNAPDRRLEGNSSPLWQKCRAGTRVCRR